MGDAESAEDNRNPKVPERGLRLNEVGEGGKDRDYGLLPDVRTVNAGDDHYGCCDYESL